ncbi:hypothetical protein V6Z92_010071 [Aspergillus fumigatus]
MTGSVATNGPTSTLKELRIAWGPSGPALVLYAMVRRRLQALIRECWRQLWANNDHGPSLQRVLTAPNRVVYGVQQAQQWSRCKLKITLTGYLGSFGALPTTEASTARNSSPARPTYTGLRLRTV